MIHDADPQMVALKVPPHSAEAEQSLLGGLLLDNKAFDKVSWLAADAFYQDNHRRIYRHITRLIEAGKVADMVTVGESIESSIDKGKTGGSAYLVALAQNTPSALNIHRYAELVRDKAVLREMCNAGTEIAEAALNGGADVGGLLDAAESKILRISERATRSAAGSVDLQTVLAQRFERLDRLYNSENKSGITGVPSGFTDLDAKTAGLQAGDLIVVAGRPSMGKTALALNIAEHVAVECQQPVAIFSMEMGAGQLGDRLLGSVARVDQHLLRTGQLTEEDWKHLSNAMGKLHAAPIEIDETGGLTALDLRARARRIARRVGKLGLVVVDYLQLMEASRRTDNRANDVAEISRSMKAMAKELGCPVIALSQLNRNLELRADKRPTMADLRESGAIEQDADLILFLYRHEVYYPEDPSAAGFAECIIGKQRNGPIGKVDLTFLGKHTRFENCARAPTYRAPAPRKPRSTVVTADFKSKASGEDGR